ncbi:SDR family oxidoreductase [Amycolatopsis rubida]|uniref:SDR family oxidoreductase n=1 Tax=Amycolatopsis rubida TaxID=112413 RepID=A0ABX0BRH2_9PSEU|nr:MULTISPECIES: SDR family oxidoreductase [Amycolatopsis]MYW90922.1 SDR family oxidoreductase [Amycolatopsis rubida]NEC55907.1 SDR family oxidoreductase [Amycolatopsis rubida]OAP26010.1 3-oxoacyl-[acyl-carrier-protein] reductase FabG [Amycolatopsis sp. M39]
MGRLSGKAALVTGGSRGIGRAVAERLARDGALPAVHYGSNETAARETVAAITEAGGRAFPVGAELGVPDDAATLAAALDTDIDILVHNAGRYFLRRPIEVLTPEEFDKMFAVNVKAPFFLTQRLLPRLRDGGRIIAVSSVATRVTAPDGIAYPMTKGALDVFSRTLAKHLAPRGITVNSVGVGYTRTDMTAALLDVPENLERNVSRTALGRIGEVEDVADAVAFLASDDARWITGTKLDVSGGVGL